MTDTPATVLVQQLRWMAVLCQGYTLVNMIEPARNALWYETSWAYRVAAVSSLGPAAFIAWFALSMMLALPLLLGLIFAPQSRMTRGAVGANAVGTFMAAVGHFYIASTIARWDAPGQVLAAFAANAALLVAGAMVMACWQNARHVTRYLHDQRAARCVGSKG